MTYNELKHEWESDTPYIMAYTSGSTGKPRPVRLDKNLVRRSALRTVRRFNISETSALHSCIAPDFIGGKMMLIRALVSGARFTYETPSNTPLTGVDPDKKLTMVSVVPSQMLFIADRIDTLPEVESFLVGGSRLPRSLVDKIVSRSIRAYESYGMTETASHIAVRQIDGNNSPFQPLPGISVSKDDRGCLVIDMGDDGTVITNDIVTFPDGHPGGFIIEGRIDDVIITGGKKAHPAEIENKISELFPGKDICVTSRPDSLWGERIVLLVETPSAIDETTLRSQMRDLLPAWQIPKEIVALPKLPRTRSGKIIRKHKI